MTATRKAVTVCNRWRLFAIGKKPVVGMKEHDSGPPVHAGGFFNTAFLLRTSDQGILYSSRMPYCGRRNNKRLLRLRAKKGECGKLLTQRHRPKRGI